MLFFFLQAVAFQLPHSIWKIIKGRKLSCYLNNLHRPEGSVLIESMKKVHFYPICFSYFFNPKIFVLAAILDENDEKKHDFQIDIAVETMLKSIVRNRFGGYFAGKLITDVLNLINVSVQIMLINKLFRHNFFRFGLNIVEAVTNGKISRPNIYLVLSTVN